MSHTLQDRVRNLMRHPPNALRGNPFHFKNWVRFPALFDAVDQVLHLHRLAGEYTLKPAEVEGLAYWVRQAAIAACAAQQAYPLHFQHLEAQFSLRLAGLLQQLADVLELESVDDFSWKFRDNIEALRHEPPRAALVFCDPETVQNAA